MPRTGKTPSPAIKPTATPPLLRSQSEQPVDEWKDDNDDAFDAWGAMDDDKDAQEEDPFSAAANSPSQPVSSAPPAPFDDGGEPDFAGWLAAQSKAKGKKPLPKGLSKSTKTATQSTATSSSKVIRPKATAQSVSKKIDTKPKDESMDDGGWDAWD